MNNHLLPKVSKERARGTRIGIKPAAALALYAVLTLTGCDRIDDGRMQFSLWQQERRERAYAKDLDRMAKDPEGIYQLDYRLKASSLPAIQDTADRFQAIPGGRFDMTPWFRQNGVEATAAVISAVFDPAARTITIIDTGPNVVLIETILRPLRPDSYHRVDHSSRTAK